MTPGPRVPAENSGPERNRKGKQTVLTYECVLPEATESATLSSVMTTKRSSRPAGTATRAFTEAQAVRPRALQAGSRQAGAPRQADPGEPSKLLAGGSGFSEKFLRSFEKPQTRCRRAGTLSFNSTVRMTGEPMTDGVLYGTQHLS